MKLVREIPDSDSQEEWLARERAHLSQVLYRYTPLVIDRAQGSYLYTVEGRRYLDFASSTGDPARRADRGAGARQAREGVLREQRRRGRRRCHQAGPLHYRALGVDRLPGRLPRPHLWGIVTDRVEELLPGALRTVLAGRVPRALPLPVPQPNRARRRGDARVCLQFHRRDAGHAGAAEERGRVHRRAGAGRGRLRGATGGLHAAAPQTLR